MGDEVIGSLFVVGVYVMFATVPGFAVGGTQGLCRMTLAVSLDLFRISHRSFSFWESWVLTSLSSALAAFSLAMRAVARCLAFAAAAFGIVFVLRPCLFFWF